MAIDSVHAGSTIACPQCSGKFQAPLPTANTGQTNPYGGGPGPAPMSYSSYGGGGSYQEAASKKMVAGLCGILLGGMGIHKFILGMPTPGVIMLVVSMAGAITGACLIVPILGPMAMGVIGLVEGIIYLTKSDEEFYQTYMVEKKEWF